MKLSLFKKITFGLSKIYLPQDAQPLFKKNNSISDTSTSLILNNFGNKNRNKIFYIIRRSPGAGLFSNFIFVLNHLKIAISCKYIPIVDMKNFPTIYNEFKKINNTNNSWNYYFKPVSNFNLKEIYKSKNVYFTSGIFHKNLEINPGTYHQKFKFVTGGQTFIKMV